MTPHYVNTSPNPRVSYALLQRLLTLVDIEVSLDDMRQAGEGFEVEVSKRISNQAEIDAYVQRLEKRYDAVATDTGEVPSPDSMVQELEEFLKGQRQGTDRPEDP